MTPYCRIAFVLGSFAAQVLAGAYNAGPARTEELPSDGGDLGKAYIELAAAMKAGDKERAGRLLDPRQWHLANKQKSWFGMFAHGLRQQLQQERGARLLSTDSVGPVLICSGTRRAKADGQRVLVTNAGNDSVSLWKSADLTPFGNFSTGAGTMPFAACSDGVSFWITLTGPGQIARF